LDNLANVSKRIVSDTFGKATFATNLLVEQQAICCSDINGHKALRARTKIARHELSIGRGIRHGRLDHGIGHCLERKRHARQQSGDGVFLVKSKQGFVCGTAFALHLAFKETFDGIVAYIDDLTAPVVIARNDTILHLSRIVFFITSKLFIVFRLKHVL
jgi:hypothetical protein